MKVYKDRLHGQRLHEVEASECDRCKQRCRLCGLVACGPIREHVLCTELHKRLLVVGLGESALPALSLLAVLINTGRVLLWCPAQLRGLGQARRFRFLAIPTTFNVCSQQKV